MIPGNKSTTSETPQWNQRTPEGGRGGAPRRRYPEKQVFGKTARPTRKKTHREAHAERRRHADDLATALERTIYLDCAPKIRHCHTKWTAWRCRAENRVFSVPMESCGVRLCPFEQHDRSVTAIHKYGPALARYRRLRYAVLTIRNVPVGDLREAFDFLWASLRRLRRSRRMARRMRGGIPVFETTFTETSEHHPHLNVILHGSFILQAELSDEWKKATSGRGEIVDIREVTKGTLPELLKYVTKTSKLIANRDALLEVFGVLHGRRLIRPFGTLYGLKLDEVEDEDDVVGGHGPRCPDCGSRDVELIPVILRLDQVEWDDSGVLRVRSWPSPRPP